MPTFSQLDVVVNEVTYPYERRSNNAGVAVWSKSSPAGVASNAATLVSTGRTKSAGGHTRNFSMTHPTLHTIEGVETNVGANFLKLNSSWDSLSDSATRGQILDEFFAMCQDPIIRNAIINGGGFF